MASVSPHTSIRDYQRFIADIYDVGDNRFFSRRDLLGGVERLVMRGLKGIRKKEHERTRINLLLSLGWFMSLLNRMHIDAEDETWKRFPYRCSYCAHCPCICREIRPTKRRALPAEEDKRPKTLREFQQMFREVYPPETRTLEQAGIHLAEETGELWESLLLYRGTHKEAEFKKLVVEVADFLSCVIGVFNSLDIDVADALSEVYVDNCQVCHQLPCSCSFEEMLSLNHEKT